MNVRLLSRSVCFALALSLMGTGQVTAQQCPPPLAAPACTGQAKLSMRVSKAGGRGILSLTHCPFPSPCLNRTQAPVTVTISDAACATSTLQFPASPTRRGSGCTGNDAYSAAQAGKLKFIFGAGESVLGTQLNIPLTSGLTPPVNVTITDGRGYSVGATLTKCRSNKATQIWCN